MLDGILIIDKPAGLTSHDVVARVRRTLQTRRVGHTGTLDPFATGVLIVVVGRATRLAQFLSTAVKEYEATVRFGYATDTGDRTGQRLTASAAQDETEERVLALQESEIETALSGLRGEIEQVPPMYSAKKIQGRKLYELARRGIEVERAAVRVTIYELEALPLDDRILRSNEDGTYDLLIRVKCSAGTYIRTLAESIGESVGAPAHLASLRRTRAGDFGIEEAIGLDELPEKVAAGEAGILSSEAALSSLPFLHLTSDEARRALHGVALSVRDETNWPKDLPVRMLDANGSLIAVGFYDSASRALRPRIVFSPEK